MSPSNYALNLPSSKTSIPFDRHILRSLPMVFPGRPCARFLTTWGGQSVCCTLTTKTEWQGLTTLLCRKGTHLSAPRQYYYSRKGEKSTRLRAPKVGRQTSKRLPFSALAHADFQRSHWPQPHAVQGMSAWGRSASFLHCLGSERKAFATHPPPRESTLTTAASLIPE